MGTFLLLLFFSLFFFFFIETLWNQSVAEYENKTSRRESKYRSLDLYKAACSVQRLYEQECTAVVRAGHTGTEQCERALSE